MIIQEEKQTFKILLIFAVLLIPSSPMLRTLINIRYNMDARDLKKNLSMATTHHYKTLASS